MKIGIISDSHGKKRRLKAALEILRERGMDAVVHCGDLGSEECVRLLAAAGVPAYAVAGNMDKHADLLEETARGCGVNFSHRQIEVPIGGGQHLVATHGNSAEVLNELVFGGQFPYVCHGHSHRVRDERYGRVRLINPGALRSPRAPRHPTVAMLDTQADALEFIEVPR